MTVVTPPATDDRVKARSSLSTLFGMPAIGALIGAIAIAVLFLATGINGLVLLGADSWVNNVFYGAAVILAVTFSRVIYVRARKKNIV